MTRRKGNGMVMEIECLEWRRVTVKLETMHTCASFSWHIEPNNHVLKFVCFCLSGVLAVLKGENEK